MSTPNAHQVFEAIKQLDESLQVCVISAPSAPDRVFVRGLHMALRSYLGCLIKRHIGGNVATTTERTDFGVALLLAVRALDTCHVAAAPLDPCLRELCISLLQILSVHYMNQPGEEAYGKWHCLQPSDN